MAPEPSRPQGIETIQVRAVGYRYSSYDTPLWARPNSEGGRWHSPGDGPTQYLSLSTDGAWAELIRREQLSSEQEVALIHIQMWALQIDQDLIADYSTFEKADAAGIDAEALVSDDYRYCRAQGARLRADGYQGVLAPSAALPDEQNLTLFGARIASSWDQPKLLHSWMPARIIAVGSPPRGLFPQVRRYGEEHAALAPFLTKRPQR